MQYSALCFDVQFDKQEVVLQKDFRFFVASACFFQLAFYDFHFQGIDAPGVLSADLYAFHTADAFFRVGLIWFFNRDGSGRTDFCTGCAERTHVIVCLREKGVFPIFFIRRIAGNLDVDLAEILFFSDAPVQLDAVFCAGLQVSFVRSSCADGRHDGVFRRECGCADHFKAAVFYFGFELQERIVIFAAAVGRDQGRRGSVPGNVLQIIYEEGRHAPVVYRDAEDDKIIGGKF